MFHRHPADGTRSTAMMASLAEFRVRRRPRCVRCCAASRRQRARQPQHAEGAALHHHVWTLDAARGTLTLSADANDPRLQRLLDADEVVAVALPRQRQAAVRSARLLLVHGGQSSALQAALAARDLPLPAPRQLSACGRSASSSPMARCATRNGPTCMLALRVIDVSIGGCALRCRPTCRDCRPALEVKDVTIELDADTRFEASCKLHHVTADQPRCQRRPARLLDASIWPAKPSARCSATSTRRRSGAA